MFQKLKTQKYLLLLGVVFFFWLIGASQVSACSCPVPPPPGEALDQADVVFSGRVVNYIDQPEGPKVSSADLVKAKFNVSKIWKGPQETTFVVSTARHSLSCGYSFEKGTEYIVYAFDKDDGLITTVCTRTKPLSRAKEDLAKLGQGKEPKKVDSIPSPQGSSLDLSRVILVVGIAAVVLAIAGFLVISSKKNK